MTIKVYQRPYNVFVDNGEGYLVASDTAQEMINLADRVIRATRNRVVLADGPCKVVIIPATHGGGDGFQVIE